VTCGHARRRQDLHDRVIGFEDLPASGFELLLRRGERALAFLEVPPRAARPRHELAASLDLTCDPQDGDLVMLAHTLQRLAVIADGEDQLHAVASRLVGGEGGRRREESDQQEGEASRGTRQS
jgi:hypothetical protein